MRFTVHSLLTNISLVIILYLLIFAAVFEIVQQVYRFN